MTEPRTWVIELPASLVLINSNDRIHWGAKARRTKAIRQAAFDIATALRIPRLDRAQIDFFIHPGPKTRRRDPANWQDSTKGAVDGIVDAGVLVDDSSSFVDGPFPYMGGPRPALQLVLHIIEMAPASPGVGA